MKVAFFEFKKTLEQKKYLVFGLVVSFIVFNIFFFKDSIYNPNYLYSIHDYQNSLGNNSPFVFLFLYLLKYDFNLIKIIRFKSEKHILMYHCIVAVCVSITLSLIQVLCHMLIGYIYSIFIGGYFDAIIFSFLSFTKLFLVLLSMCFVYFTLTTILKNSNFVLFLLIAFFMLCSYTYSILTKIIGLLSFNNHSPFLEEEIIFSNHYTIYKMAGLILFINILIRIHKMLLSKIEYL